jgi:hypothetical protein
MSTMRINSFTHFFSFIVFLGIFLLPQEKLAAGGVAATLVNSHTVRRTDAQTGRFLDQSQSTMHWPWLAMVKRSLFCETGI